MAEGRFYTTQLQAGLGLITETRQLLELHEPGLSVAALTERALGPFTDNGKGFGQQVIKRFTGFETLTELNRLGTQAIIVEH